MTSVATSQPEPSGSERAPSAHSRAAASFDFAGFFAGRRVLVTGGFGFIGSNIARRLADYGARVTVVDALMPDSGANRANLDGYAQKLTSCVANLTDPAVAAEFVRGQDVIFNLAGQVSHMASMQAPLQDLDANVRAQVVLLEACRVHAKEARIVFASTRQIYGKPRYLPVDERHPLDPVDVNGINKMAGEAYHTLYQRIYGLSCVCLRLTNVYGPRMRIRDGRQTFLGIWLRHVVEDAEFEVWGGEQQRDIVYIDDAVDAFLAAASPGLSSGSAYNVGGGAPLRLSELAALLVTVGKGGRFSFKPFPPTRAPIDIGDYFSDDRRFRTATGWHPRVEPAEGFARSIHFYRECLHAYI